MALSLGASFLAGSVLAPFAGRAAERLLPISTPSGGRLGEDAAAYYDKAFPGTSPWERLGTQNPAAAQVAARSQQRIANRQIGAQAATSLAVARTQANAQVRSAEIAAGKEPTPLQTSQIELNQAQAQQATAMLGRIDAQTRRDLAQLVVDNKQAEFATRLVKSGIYANEARSIAAIVWTALNWTSEGIQDASSKVMDYFGGQFPVNVSGMPKGIDLSGFGRRFDEFKAERGKSLDFSGLGRRFGELKAERGKPLDLDAFKSRLQGLISDASEWPSQLLDRFNSWFYDLYQEALRLQNASHR